MRERKFSSFSSLITLSSNTNIQTKSPTPLYSSPYSFHLDLYGKCAFDDASDRVLQGHYFSSETMTVEMCLSICRDKGFHYSGLQWQIECYCGNEPVNGFQWAWTDKCHDRCAGNSNQFCGGSYAMSVYSTPKTYIHGLCIYDFPSPRRVLSDLSITGEKNLTIQNCSEICKDYEYFGLQNGDECHCGNKDTHFIPTHPSSCNKRCNGDRTQICGGSWRLTVYENVLFMAEKNNTESVTGTTESTAVTTEQATTATSIITANTRNVVFTGELGTNVDWDIDLKDSQSDLYQKTAVNVQIDLETLLTEVDGVHKATVTIIGFEKIELGRKRRQESVYKAKVNYFATLTVVDSSPTREIMSNIEFFIQIIDPSRFNSFDSFNGFIIEHDVENGIDSNNSIIKTTAATTTEEWTVVSTTNDSVATKSMKPAMSAVLVLSNLWSTSRPMVINLAGEFSFINVNMCHIISNYFRNGE